MKFQLKNVGKIKDAEFELKPLTVFIGANGSGKTYAASALWGLLSYFKNSIIDRNIDLFIYEKILSQSLYQQFVEKVELQISTLVAGAESINIHFSQDEIKNICEKIHDYIKENTHDILFNTFKFDLFQESCITFNSNQLERYDILVKRGLWKDENNPHENQRTYPNIPNNTYAESLTFFAKFNQSKFYTLWATNYHYNREYKDIVQLYLNDILHMIFHNICLNQTNFNISNSIYIPAARTGLMFITHDIVQNQFEFTNRSIFNDRTNQQQNNDLTAPLNDFIAKIHNASRPKSELNTENQSFNQIMGGKLVQREGQYRFDFQPNGLEQTVPLSASSSLVTELAALSALEENIRKGTFIILEEPEAHLHLSAQREMAKLIVRLINEKGCRILLTTHSDTFLQQINNLIMLEKLSHHNENVLADFGIQAAEVIGADDVAVYDFQCVGNETHVENLVCGEYGFVAKSMNDVLIALAKETQSIIEQIDDLEAE